MEATQPNERLRSFIALMGKEVENSPSPYMNWLKPVVLSAENGALRCSFVVRKEMTNPYGILHGGVTAGIIDDLIGATVFTLGLEAQFTTINNAIDYFATAREGDVIEGHTLILKKGRTIMNLQCEIYLPAKQRLLARGYSNMLNVG